MSSNGGYEEYAKLAIDDYNRKAAVDRDLLVDSLNGSSIERVLDIGCGAGQEMLPFVAKKNAYCVGVDVGEELGKVGAIVAREAGFKNEVAFARSIGEELPFADSTFDVVICQIAITLMNNQKAIAEVSRVLKPNGVFLLKTHSPAFYLGMIRKRINTFSPRQLAYPVISLVGGTFQVVTGKYPDIEFFKGREVFQTLGTLERELAKNSMEIARTLPDNKIDAPSYYIVKK